jgi:hypothetical protein
LASAPRNRAKREQILFDFNKKYLGVEPDGTINLDWTPIVAAVEAHPSVPSQA